MAGVFIDPGARRHITPASKLAGDPGHRLAGSCLRGAGGRKQSWRKQCGGKGGENVGAHRNFSFNGLTCITELPVARDRQRERWVI